MLKSMTGFGKLTTQWKGKNTSLEVRSLNSKFFDLNLKIPALFREKEIELRNVLSKKLTRGKVELSISINDLGEAGFHKINQELFKLYFEDLNQVSDTYSLNKDRLLTTLLRMPNIQEPEAVQLDSEDWEKLVRVIDELVDKFDKFRLDEGEKLEQDFRDRVQQIDQLNTEVEKTEEQRRERIRERLNAKLTDLKADSSFDENRLEQEMIYYVEKLDITEEIVRLRSHCEYFNKALNEQVDVKGKKLGFISQEMGREINTIGSKANDADLQRLVVQMKEQLEKIKEQLNNVL